MPLSLLCVLNLLISQLWAASAADLTTLMQSGNTAYQQENYQAAVQYYEKILQEGYTSGELYYNLGNAYYRLGDLGRAILNYERAQRYLPRSESVTFNLRLANLQVKDRIDVPPPFFLLRWYQQTVHALTARAWGALFVGLFLAAAGLTFIRFWFDTRKLARTLQRLAILLGLGAALVLIPLSARYRYEYHSREGIILSPVVTCLAAPQEGSTELFVVHTGTKVKVLGSDGEWYKIELVDGKQGWLPMRTVEKI